MLWKKWSKFLPNRLAYTSLVKTAKQMFMVCTKCYISTCWYYMCILLKVWYKKLLISVDPWTIEQRVLISSELLIKGSLVMLVSVDSRDAENALPKDWSVNDIADVEVTVSASGVLGIRWSLARRFWLCCFCVWPRKPDIVLSVLAQTGICIVPK